MGFKLSSVEQPKATSKDILKIWLGIKNSIGKNVYAFYLNQKNSRICAKVYRVELSWSN